MPLRWPSKLRFDTSWPARGRLPAKGGRPRIDDLAALTGIAFVLKTGISWGYLPRELGCGSGMTCWRRLHEWMLAGVWQLIHKAILRRLREHDQIMWDRVSVDAASVPAPAGDEQTSTEPFFPLPAHSSAGGTSKGFVRRSKPPQH
jgi:transposase